MALNDTECTDKRILVTGGCGFIGSHFIELLLEQFENSTIHIIDSFEYCVSRKTQTYLQELNVKSSNHISIFEIDITNFRVHPSYDYIVNFAAQSHVDRSIEGFGEEFVTTNINGTYSMLRLMDDDTRFVQIGTDEVYGSLSLDDDPSVETDPLDPSSVYSSTKASADLIVSSFYKTYKRDVIITRCTNNFGPRQFTEKFIPVVISNALTGKQIPVYGDGRNTRQWIDVKDHCKQILIAMLYGESGEIYNIKPLYDEDSEYSNVNIVSKILDIVGAPYELIQFVDDRKGHDIRYSLNDDKIQKLISNTGLDATPGSTFDEDLKTTIDWYEKNTDWWN